jgi:cytochrome c-type biogenesis protein
MAARSSTRPAADRRILIYAAFAALLAGPLVAFTIGGLTNDSFSLEGPGGPLLAFSAGVLSFVSPCVLPIVPVYITQISGAAVREGRIAAERRTTFLHGLSFIGGLSLVFIALGASAGLLGSFFLQDNQRELQQFSGVVLVAMGILLVPEHGARNQLRSGIALLALAGAYLGIAEAADLRGDRIGLLQLGIALMLVWLRYSGWLPLRFFSRTFEVSLGDRTQQRVSYGRSALVGSAFGLGWTPCIGPILASILTLAGTQQEASALTGTYLLIAYSAGFSVPFLVTALALSDSQAVFRKIAPYTPAIEAISAVMLVGLGILLFYNKVGTLAAYFGFDAFNEGL